MFVDTPGFLVGKAGERKKITGKIMNWMNALALTTVPKLTVIIRKSYGQGWQNMGGGRYSDVLVAWPTAEISFVAPEIAVNIVHGIGKEDDTERYNELLEEISRQTEPWDAAGIFGLTDVIEPKDTRLFLAKMLKLYVEDSRCGIGQHLMHNWPTSF
jgi:acetyl-CoA carboxylase carboxyltransferase component